MSSVVFDDYKEMFRDYSSISMCHEKMRAIGMIGLATIAGVAYLSSLWTWRSAGESFRDNLSHGYSLLFPCGEEDFLFDEEVMNTQVWETAFHVAALLAAE